MKVGFYSPLPPAPTGVADYSAAVLRALQPFGEVEANAAHADVRLYHIGNNRLHADIYRQALRTPGVVVLHDAVLHHFLLGTLAERAYIDEFTYNYGTWNQDQARKLWRQRARSAADPVYFRFPMLKRQVECSLAVIVHNPAAAELVARHARDAKIYEIPHLFEAPAQAPNIVDVMRLRQGLDVAPRTCLFAVFGHLRESKRLLPVLRAFQRARRSAPMTLLVAGDFVSRDLERATATLLTSDSGVRRIGFIPANQFWLYAAAADACINLRYPTAGETSGIAIRLMGIGKPVLLTAAMENSRYPDSACLRVDPGVAEEDMLAEYMLFLAQNSTAAESIGRHASAHIAEFHRPARVAEDYWRVLTACYHKN